MSEDFIQDMEDLNKEIALDKAEDLIPAPDLPEAPQSIHVDAYFKGFHAGFTIRKDNNRMVAVDETTRLIEGLIAKGWKPSWNTETNNAHPIQQTIDDLGKCPKCGAPNKRSFKGKIYCSDKCWLKAGTNEYTPQT